MAQTTMKKKQLSKWNFAIGTTSRVPNSGGLHYLIADFDNLKYPWAIFTYMPFNLVQNMVLQKTPHGWHLYTDAVMTFDLLQKYLLAMDADPAWVEIGKERGYYFLADKKEIDFPWPVEHMVLHYGKKRKERNTTRLRSPIP